MKTLFWISVVYTFLLSFTMIGFGRIFMKHPPKNINSVYGYRTRMSSLNKETWNFAHQYAGRFWVYSGTINLCAALLLIIILRNTDCFETAATYIIFAELIPLLLVIVFTEKALREKFDRNGQRKQ